DLSAYAHQDLPFEHVVEELNPPRSGSRHPLFQTMLVLQDVPELRLPGLRTRTEDVPTEYAKFDLTFFCALERDRDGDPAGIDITVEYSADLFDRGTAQSLA